MRIKALDAGFRRCDGLFSAGIRARNHMSTATAIRPPAVAGMFYPGNPDTLRDDLATCLAVAPAPTSSATAGGLLKAVIVPHAGYVYSGGTAGKAYALLAPLAGRIRRVVLLGPAHYAYVRGLALPAQVPRLRALSRLGVRSPRCSAPSLAAVAHPH